ncbi:MAG: hypothetical protein MJ103_06655, partial [Saccharofermentans sp.]|nr:hypothetical protein [Saccharofermentans sp.]
DGLRFRAVRNTDEASTFSHFTGVSVDGQLIDPSNYTAVSGSVIVTLNASYLNTLATGTHTISIHFNDGDSVTTTFTVTTAAAAAGVANTGEDPHSVTNTLGAYLLLAGVAAAYCYMTRVRKEED